MNNSCFFLVLFDEKCLIIHSHYNENNYDYDLFDLSNNIDFNFIFNYDSFDFSNSNSKEDLFKKENESINIENGLLINEYIENNYTNMNNNPNNRNTNNSTFLYLKKSEDKGLNFIKKNENSHINSNKILNYIPLFSTKNVPQHSKYSEDNIIIKIKTFLGNNIHKFLNGLLEKDELKLVKLEPKLFHESLKKEYILKLWNSTLKDIYTNTKISSKYKKISFYENDINIKIINKIYNENKNKEVIQILNLTYEEIFNIFIRDIKPMNVELTNKIIGSQILNISKFKTITGFFEEIKTKGKK